MRKITKYVTNAAGVLQDNGLKVKINKPSLRSKISTWKIESQSTETENVIYDGENVTYDGEQVIY